MLHVIARLAALVPRPRVNLTRFHGVFAPNSHWRAEITPARRGKRRAADKPLPVAEKHSARHKARRLKRVFKVDIELCEHCPGAVRAVTPGILPPVTLVRLTYKDVGNAKGLQEQSPPCTSLPASTIPTSSPVTSIIWTASAGSKSLTIRVRRPPRCFAKT